MNSRIIAVLASSLALFAGCSKPGTEEAKAQIIAADKAFSALSVKQGPKAAFLAYVVNDAKMLSEDTHLGTEAVENMFMHIPKTVTLSWEPSAAEVASSGDLGYTWGRYSVLTPNPKPGGSPFLRGGTYVTIWKRQPSGDWKVVLDGGNPDERK